MNKFATFLLLTAAVCLTPLSSFAATPSSEILSSLQTAREKLVAFIGAADKDDQAELQETIKTATKGVDDKLGASLSDAALSADQKAKLTEFKSVWGDFKKTRDTEIIPAVLAGEKDKAKGVAQGVQAERFKKMLSLLQ